jgi:ABC-type multidrug transport system ATPase subunit
MPGRKLCSLVPQEDILLPTFTVWETMMYAAALRLSRSTSVAEKGRIITRVLKELGIQECRHVVVGSVEKPGISGGQRRRLSLGLELIVDPSVLLLDVSRRTLGWHLY